jgi:CheY-like chemotaxis protein
MDEIRGSSVADCVPVARRRIVLIGGSDEFVNNYCRVLEYFGHEVKTTTNGYEGVEIVRSTEPDVVLCSIVLNGLDGFEVAHEIRKTHPRKPLLVAHSGYSKSAIEESAKSAGFDLYLPKATGLNHLKMVLDSVDELTECEELRF